MRLALVIAGGGLGSAARYLVGVWMVTHAGGAFPWGTLSVNIVGSFLIVGVLGGFTTFSAFSFESWRLLDQGDAARAILYVGSSVGLGLAAAVGGVVLARAIA